MTIETNPASNGLSSPRLSDAPRGMFRARRRQQAGQSVLIVLGVLFLVAFLGALFVLVVIRNLENAQRQNQVLTADYYAQAGVNYANSMLQTDPLGADWRPPLQFGTNTTDVPGYTGTLPAAPSNDPDKRWLDQGYSRYNLANGRFLLRVTYNPAAASPGASVGAVAAPNAKYLKIDVVGRQGTVDSNDPTTYTNSPAESLRAERVAYKPIGLVDYARFITNKDNTSQTAALGVPSSYDTTNHLTTPGVMDISAVTPAGATPVALTLTPYPITTTFGSPTTGTSYFNGANTAVAGGGSLRSNANLRLYGNNQIYLAGQFGDDWEIAGNLTFDQYMPGTAATAQATQANLIGTAYDGTAYTGTPVQSVFPSNDTTNFTTINGLIRDGNAGNDSAGNPRAVGRLNPPLIDSTDPVTNLTRYQVLTKPTDTNGLTSSWSDTAAPNLATVYINNGGDIQTETQLLGNPSTLREEWLRTTQTAQNWTGNFYNPPGVLITFGQITNPLLTSTTTTYWGCTLTRTDLDATGAPVKWPGTNSATVQIIYGQPPSANFIGSLETGSVQVQTQYYDAPFDFLTQYDAANTSAVVNNVVIDADGNVRVRGIVSNPAAAVAGGTVSAQHVTVVSNGIGYVEGSILRGVEGTAPGTNPARAGASVALLAKQYVCLNTTQFMLGAQDTASTKQPTPLQDVNNDYLLDFEQGTSLTFNVLLPTVYTNTGLYVSQEAGPMAGNPNTTTSGQGGFIPSDSNFTNEPLEPITMGTPGATPYPASPSTPNKTFIPFNPTYYTPLTAPLTPFTPTANLPFALTFQTYGNSIPPTTATNPPLGSSLADWTLERAAVLPADVKIEAVLYAQDNSFFVIPGDWFNTDPGDAFHQTVSGGTTIYTTDRPGNVADARFPYHGQPIDMQITIQGSISENMPADITDQAAWMQKWGWIPRYHGTQVGTDGSVTGGADTSPHAPVTAGTPTGIGVGLNFVYDPINGFPVLNPGATLPATPTYVRQDQYGRPLPSVPALPVSPDLLYNGQPT